MWEGRFKTGAEARFQAFLSSNAPSHPFLSLPCQGAQECLETQKCLEIFAKQNRSLPASAVCLVSLAWCCSFEAGSECDARGYLISPGAPGGLCVHFKARGDTCVSEYLVVEGSGGPSDVYVGGIRSCGPLWAVCLFSSPVCVNT